MNNPFKDTETNKIQQGFNSTKKKAAAEKQKKTFFQRYFVDVLGGDFLTKGLSVSKVKYLLFLAGIALVYIANSYYAEDIARSIDKINRDLKELQFEFILSKSEVMQKSKQSELARRLQQTGLKESIEPVRKIVIPKIDQP